ncbi:MAG: spore coat protein [Bacilli bacterium]|nr:spore coat protein [Bacilli bacterium]
MDNNVICNPKVEVPSTQEMNDCDYITSLLTCEKDMSVNYVYALNEASNETLYNEIFPIFKETKDFGRKVYELMFQKGWYKLEKAEENKITQKHTTFTQKVQELI